MLAIQYVMSFVKVNVNVYDAYINKYEILLLLYLFVFICCRIILYAIVMVDYDQDAGESCKDILKTRDGIERLALYHSSVGRLLFTLLL